MDNSKPIKPRDRELSPGLLRQRRNLLGISILMILFSSSGAVIDKVNILGNNINIQNPQIIPYFISLLFLYFLIRYFQYFNEENHVKSSKVSFQKNLKFYYLKYLRHKSILGVHEFRSNDVKLYFKDQSYRRDEPKNSVEDESNEFKFPWYLKIPYCLYTEPNCSSRESKNFHAKMKESEFSLWPRVQQENDYGESKSNFYSHHINCNIPISLLLKFLGILRYLFTESYFTDYYLPFVIAFISFITSIGIWFLC
ncbi:hypothetical protein N7931_15460 [Catenovulum sp. 2E275]|uniref:hypothetical protein n=1 Tax=Catenovulum sp. 2E275 TaxID=2980497 RepID=UPI0021D3E41B|nr:hypothetical protein [Catenovulum sp. 2E275]MCU4677031.1 hypothetical protein [Catenovulum sp. 2E275]